VKHNYTTEQHQFIKDNQHGISRKELADKFNKKFGTQQKKETMRAYCQNRGYRNGRDTRFAKGKVKDNGHRFTKDDTRGIPYRFKKGHEPLFELPLGTKRLHNGYEIIKYKSPNKWQYTHKWLWEKHNGKIPDKHVVMFKNGNRENITIDNLEMISMGQLAVLNRKRLISKEPELTEVAINISKLIIKSAQLGKKRGSKK